MAIRLNNNIYSNNFIDNIDQVYDDSGMNSWDDGNTGNYWSNFRGTGAYNILGPKTVDNHPIQACTVRM
jgi:nitrous oxidase accessory protein NosD